MLTYFGVLAALCVPALLATLWTGLTASPHHLATGLVSSFLAVATHSVLILFMIVTGRVLREAVRVRTLSSEYLTELNEFFARKRAYPAALLAVLAIVTAAVLGYAQRGFGLPGTVHMLAGMVAVVANLYVLTIEVRALRENQGLLDRVAHALDELDRRSPPPAESEEEADPHALERLGLSLALGAWLPWLYWGLIVWKGDLGRASVHPWIELSLAGAALWLLARRARVTA